MENNKLEKLKNVLELLQNDTVTPAKLAQFVTTLVKIVKDSKDSMENTSQEVKDYLNKAISYLDTEHSKLLEKVNTETITLDTKLTKKLEKSISDMKMMCDELMMSKPQDGYTPIKDVDYRDGIDGKDGSPDTAKEIKDKLETLKGEERLDSSAIKGLDILEKGITNRALEILDSRTKFLVNKSVKHDATLSGSGTDSDPLKVVAGSGTGIVETVVAGTGISVDSTDPANPVVTNTAPDQVVSLTAGTHIDSITGTYPNFTINAETQGGSYTLPTASDTVLGGIKVGDRLTITDGVLSADIQGGTGAVDSVNGQTGTVVLDADDISDTSTTNKFTNATDIARLANTSGTNTGDVSVTDSTEINFTLTGQDITASIKTGSIDVLKLDTGVQTSLGKADTALQTETDPLSLHLDQTTPQSIVNGVPLLIADLSDFTSGSQIVNKEYVDSVLDFEQTYYFNNTASSIGGIYYEMLDMPTGQAEATFVSGALATGNGQALVNFATIVGQPGTTVAKAGIYMGHIHAHKASAGGKPVQIYYAIYNRNLAGTETLLATSEISELLTTDKTGYELHATLLADTPVLTTDRRVIKWFANVGVTGTDAIVTLYVEGDNASTLTIPTTTEILSSVFIRQDGTKPLTANWDAGSYEIRAETFESDVATGTAPFTIASTTAVSNLNADLLDGNHASAFATALGADDNYVTDAEKIAIGTIGNKLDANTPITGATKTKITYDADGLVTAGADATTADISDSTNKRYVTDAQLTVIGNTSGTNTGDNATNSQYSGLATSKQDTLVSGTNIKTINGTTLLGSGDLTVGGGTVNTIGITTANGVSGTSSGGTDPRLTVTLGEITPSSVNGLKIDRGVNSLSTNIAIGISSLNGNNSGSGYNIAIGTQSLFSKTSGDSNVALGANSLFGSTIGNRNIAIGNSTLSSNVSGSSNIALGYHAGAYETGSDSFYVDSRNRTNTAGDKAGAILYGVMSDTPSSQTLKTNSAFTATYGMNIPTGQTYKINGTPLSYTDVGAQVAGSYLVAADITGKLDKSTYDAHTILYATTDNTPTALTVGEQTIVGRTTGGNISALAIDSDLSSVSANDDTIPSAKATKTALDTKLSLAGGTMTGSITLGENTSIDLDPAGSADGKYSGICITGTAGAALAFGDLVYLAATDSRWEKTDADSTTTAYGLIGMCVLAAAGDGSATKILLQGQIRADSKFPTLTIGAAVYLGETAGEVQTTIPTGADNVIRVVGFALTADEMYFNPSQDVQTTVA